MPSVVFAWKLVCKLRNLEDFVDCDIDQLQVLKATFVM